MKDPLSSTTVFAPVGTCASARVSLGTARNVNWPSTSTRCRSASRVTVIRVWASRRSAVTAATAIPAATPWSTPKTTTEPSVVAYTGNSRCRCTCLMCAKLTICTPTTMTRAASAASGTSSSAQAASPAPNTTQTPCSTVELREAAPALTLADPRIAPPAIGSPPSSPDTTFAVPCPASSRFSAERPTAGPGRSAASLSIATADSSDSMLATIVTVRTAAATPSSGPEGSVGSAWSSQPGSETRGSAVPALAEVATAMAASGAGTVRAHRPARPGSRGQATSTATVTAPISRVAACGCANSPGSAARLLSAELLGLSPSTTWSWPIAIVTPMPASIACMIAGLTASAARATRSAPRAS